MRYNSTIFAPAAIILAMLCVFATYVNVMRQVEPLISPSLQLIMNVGLAALLTLLFIKDAITRIALAICLLVLYAIFFG